MDNEQNKKDEPAFVVADKNTIFALGLTKREWFAGMALQGLRVYNSQEAARVAVEHADALIAELAKGEGK